MSSSRIGGPATPQRSARANDNPGGMGSLPTRTETAPDVIAFPAARGNGKRRDTLVTRAAPRFGRAAIPPLPARHHVLAKAFAIGRLCRSYGAPPNDFSISG